MSDADFLDDGKELLVEIAQAVNEEEELHNLVQSKEAEAEEAEKAT